jgi:beta-lactamase class C
LHGVEFISAKIDQDFATGDELFIFAAMRFFVLGSALLVMIGLTNCEQATQPAAKTAASAASALDSAQLALSKRYLEHFNVLMRQSRLPGAAVAIVQDSQVLLLRGFGVRDARTGDTVNEHTAFRLGSLSKGFTGVLAGICVQNGRIGWEQSVQQVVPYFQLRDRQQAKRIQLWHLLSHSSGLPYHAFTNMIESDYDLQTIVSKYFPKAPVSGREGQFYAYQNVAFCLGGQMLAQVEGTTYGDLLRQRLLEPLRMRYASSSVEALRSSNNYALPHAFDGWRWHPQALSGQYYGDFVAAGGINASASDMAAWLRLLLGHRPDVVADSTLARVFAPVVGTDKERHIFPHWAEHHTAGYAMGWRILKHDGHTIVYHAGAVNGYYCEIALDRERGFGICVLTNAPTDLSGQCVQDFFDLVYER